MFKSLIAVVVLSAFAMAGSAAPALSQPGSCSNAPKNSVPCVLTQQGPRPFRSLGQ
jgi:hypothetical protein